MEIAIGCDEAGYELKESLIEHIRSLGHKVVDYGSYKGEIVMYPEIGEIVAQSVAEKKQERGVLICGTGIGMCITANKIQGVRAAVCHDSFSTVRSRASNNAQIMCMGARVIGVELAKQLIELWLSSEFSGGKSTQKVELISEIEKLHKAN